MWIHIDTWVYLDLGSAMVHIIVDTWLCIWIERLWGKCCIHWRKPSHIQQQTGLIFWNGFVFLTKTTTPTSVSEIMVVFEHVLLRVPSAQSSSVKGNFNQHKQQHWSSTSVCGWPENQQIATTKGQPLVARCQTTNWTLHVADTLLIELLTFPNKNTTNSI